MGRLSGPRAAPRRPRRGPDAVAAPCVARHAIDATPARWLICAQVMNDTLRRQFLALYEEPLLEQLLESFQLRYPGVEFPPLPPRGDLDVTEVLAADYFFS